MNPLRIVLIAGAAFVIGSVLFDYRAGLVLCLVSVLALRTRPPKTTVIPKAASGGRPATTKPMIDHDPVTIEPRNAPTVTPPPLPKAQRIPLRPQVITHATSPSQPSWLRLGQTFEFAGVKITRGLLYTIKHGRGLFEPSVIDLSLPVQVPELGNDADLFGAAASYRSLGYFPNYAQLDPIQRGAYLKWLSYPIGTEPKCLRDPGFTFLYFYGLERRVLLENDRTLEIGSVVSQLLEAYGEGKGGEAISAYLSDFLLYWAFTQGADAFVGHADWLLKIPAVRSSPKLRGFLLSALCQTGGTLGAEEASALFFEKEDLDSFKLSVTDEFKKAFRTRFDKLFPGGFVLTRAKGSKVFAYVPASSNLRSASYQLQGPSALLGDEVSVIGDALEASLDDAAAALGRPRRKASSKLILKSDGSEAVDTRMIAAERHSFETGLRKLGPDEPCLVLPASAVAGLLGYANKGTLSNRVLREIAETVSVLGYGFEPNPLFHDYTRKHGLEVALLPGKCTSLKAREYLGFCALAQISAVVARAGGLTEADSEAIIRPFLGGEGVDPELRARVVAYTRLVMRLEDNAAAGIGAIARHIPIERATDVVKLLIRLAARDGEISDNEENAFRRIISALKVKGQDAAELYRDIKEIREAQAQAKQKAKSLVLDMIKVDEITRETEHVISILSDAMADPEDGIEEGVLADATIPEVEAEAAVPEVEPASDAPKEEVKVEEPGSEDIPSWTVGLSKTHALFVVRLVQRASWTRGEFKELAAGLNLMPAAAADSVNEWAMDSLGDMLLEGEDPISINVTLIPATP